MPETIIKLQLFPIKELPSSPAEYLLTYGINDKNQIEMHYGYCIGGKWTIPVKDFHPEYWSYIPKIPPEPLRGKLCFISFECEFE